MSVELTKLTELQKCARTTEDRLNEESLKDEMLIDPVFSLLLKLWNENKELKNIKAAETVDSKNALEELIQAMPDKSVLTRCNYFATVNIEGVEKIDHHWRFECADPVKPGWTNSVSGTTPLEVLERGKELPGWKENAI